MSKSLFDIGAVKFEYSKPNLTLPSPERRGCPFPFQGKAGDEAFQVLEGTAPVKLTGIFTGIVFSPSWSPRQFSSHYTIRARRNLPDKEFRSSTPKKDSIFTLFVRS